MCAMLNIWDDCSSDEEGKMPVKIEIEKSITVKVGEVPESEDEQIQLAIQKIQSPIRELGLNQIFFVPEASGEFQSRGKTYPGLEIFMTDFDEQLIKSPEPTFEQLVEGTQFMVGMVQPSNSIEWSKKISEFEDFLGIGDKASKMVQEQKAKARILQSVLAAEDAEEAERKVMKMAELEEEKAKATPEAKEVADLDEDRRTGPGIIFGSSELQKKPPERDTMATAAHRSGIIFGSSLAAPPQWHLPPAPAAAAALDPFFCL
ncbi:hypothetical protein JCGZ_03269 [Jatropha curcas]|uniref:Uncharacterized protein n=1 Tax=Jatropha curcas TaxID=180498 RepID=A0A067L484_JATCU|nr:hypothetical protein JCGZ_03269 [Jatropha curcas]